MDNQYSISLSQIADSLDNSPRVNIQGDEYIKMNSLVVRFLSSFLRDQSDKNGDKKVISLDVRFGGCRSGKSG